MFNNENDLISNVIHISQAIDPFKAILFVIDFIICIFNVSLIQFSSDNISSWKNPIKQDYLIKGQLQVE